MSISGLAANVWTPAARTQASDSVTSLFASPNLTGTMAAATTTPPGASAGGTSLGQIASELQALLLRLQGGGAPAGADKAADGSSGSTTAGGATDAMPASSSSDATGGNAAAASDSAGVSAWLARALQAYAPAAGPAGGLIGLAASAIA